MPAIFLYPLLRNHNQLKRSNLTNRQVWRMPTYLQQPVKCYCQTCADNPLLGAAATFEIGFRVIISTENQKRAENSELTYISFHVLVENNLFFHLSSIFCVWSHIGQISSCCWLVDCKALQSWQSDNTNLCTNIMTSFGVPDVY